MDETVKHPAEVIPVNARRAAKQSWREYLETEQAVRTIYFIFGVIEALLAVRFILFALGANEVSGFVRLIYGLSRPFALPFQGIFSEPALGTSVFEWASLVGIIVYALVAYGLARLAELIYAPAPRAR